MKSVAGRFRLPGVSCITRILPFFAQNAQNERIRVIIRNIGVGITVNADRCLVHDILIILPKAFEYKGSRDRSDLCDVDHVQAFFAVLKAGDQSSCGIEGGQNVDTGLDGVPADHETVMAADSPLVRGVDDQIDLMA